MHRMGKKNNYEGIKQAAANIGVFIDESDLSGLVSDYIFDSLMFVGFMVEIENIFEISIPDEYLLDENLTFENILLIIDELKNKNEII